MSLKIIDGSRVEDLAEGLKKELKTERAAKGAFETLKVAVANPNLGNWLKMKVLAGEMELCAGIEMPFLTQELERVLLANCEPGTEIVSADAYPVLILNILMKSHRAEYAPFCRYIKEENYRSYRSGPLTVVSQREARRAVQLAEKLARLLDGYEATGYLSLLDEFKDRSEAYTGEAALVEDMQGVLSLRRVFDRVKSRPPKGEQETIILFGHTAMTALQREILEWTAQTHKVIWYRPAAELKVGEGVKVRVAGAPGIRREVEWVHDEVLSLVWDHNDQDGKPVKKPHVGFSDIAVLVADMPKYRAMIESVFDGRGRIPYGLINATTQNYSSYLDGFLALMDIARYGLNRARLFAALDNPSVQRGMGFSREDVDEWRQLAVRTGAFDGFKPADSDEGNVSGHFDWSWALQRLRLGLVTGKIGGIELEALDAESVQRFSEVVETMYRRLSALNDGLRLCGSKDCAEWPETWAGRLHAVMDEFLAADADNALEQNVRSAIVRTLNGLDSIEGNQGYRLPLAFVESAVSGTECAKGGYLRHGVTVGGLNSLAHVPFKYVFVMGITEGSLPGKNDRSTLDVRNELEDNKRTDDDLRRAAQGRAAFAAALNSAREQLILTYQRLDLQTDAKLYPSSLVREAAPDVEIEEIVLDRPIGETELQSEEAAHPGETVERVEPSWKDLAAFVRDPFNAYFERRFGVCEEKYRSSSLDAASPLGVPYGQTLWDLQKAMILRKFNETAGTARKTGAVTDAFLGDFALAKLSDGQAWADESVTDEDRRILEDPAAAKDMAVLCRNYRCEDEAGETIAIPPGTVMETLFEFLDRVCSSENDTLAKFRIRVIAFGKAVQTWVWELRGADAQAYLDGVKECFMKCPPAARYDTLREALLDAGNIPQDDVAWDGLAASLEVGGGGLVIEKCLNTWRRPPTGTELKELYLKLFKLPMTGKLEENAEGELA